MNEIRLPTPAPTFGPRPSGPFPIAVSWAHGSTTPPPVLQKRPHRPGRYRSVLALLFLLGTPLAFAGGVVGTVWIATRGPREAAQAFAKAVKERRFERARRMLVDELQDEMTIEAFRAQFEGSQYSGRGSLTFSSASLEDGRACLEGKVSSVAVTFRMREVEGEWRIESTVRGHHCSDRSPPQR